MRAARRFVNLTSPSPSHPNSNRCSQYKGGIFKVANYDRWLVIVNGPRWIEEIIRYPDDMMSFERAGEEVGTISEFYMISF